MTRDFHEDFLRLEGAWAVFELMSIRKRDDYLKLFCALRCKIDDQVDFQAQESLRTATQATVLIEIFGEQDHGAASSRGPVHAMDKPCARFSNGRVLAIFADGRERWATVGVAANVLQAGVECIIDGLDWKLRGEQKH